MAKLRMQKYRRNMTDEQINKRKQKDKEYYERKKASNAIKPIAKMTAKEQRIKRKQWRINSKRYYANKKVKMAIEKQSSKCVLMPENSTLQTSLEDSAQKKRGRKIVNKSKAKVYRRNKILEEKVMRLKKKLKMYRKRDERKNKDPVNFFSPSPSSKVKKITQGLNVSPEVRKRLVFGEVLQSQLKEKNRQIKKNTPAKQIFQKLLAGKILKKYKLQHLALTYISYKQNAKYRNVKSLEYSRKKRKDCIGVSERNKIRLFLERDMNSRMCPGKKDFISYNNIKKQKRLLQDTIINLHQKYVAETGSTISATSFWRAKPFWVVRPKMIDRDTCLCQKHANIEFIVSKLKMVGALAQGSGNSLLKEMACDLNNKLCMTGICIECKNKQLPEIEEANDKDIQYHQFKTVTEVRNIKGEEKKIKLMKKVTENCSVSQLLQKLKTSLPAFKEHVFNMNHQHVILKQKKNDLKQNEILLHIDFSMNYTCKLMNEAQSMHFGASKKQLSLHTVVMYGKNQPEEVYSKSFCSVSENLDHQAHGVWAHLFPVLTSIKETINLTKVNTIHFVSDGPSAQYRNRSNIFLLLDTVPKLIPEIENITWNYTESGHGKGPMDGIGGYVKRTADNFVLNGNDITSAAEFVNIFQKKSSSVNVLEVEPKNFSTMKEVLKNIVTKPVPKIMRIHQLLWTKYTPKNLYIRSLSCFSCNEVCIHHALGKGILKIETVPSSTSQVEASTSQAVPTPTSHAVPTSTSQDVTASLTEPTTSQAIPTASLAQPSTSHALVSTSEAVQFTSQEDMPSSEHYITDSQQALFVRKNSWVAVIFDDNWYPGQVQEDSINGTINVSFMERKGSLFYWSQNPYTHKLKIEEILCEIHKPPVPATSQCSRAVLYSLEEVERINELMETTF